MEVCSLASGASLAEFDIADVEGKSARALKSMLAAKLDIPRFRRSDSSRKMVHGKLRMMRCFFGKIP